MKNERHKRSDSRTNRLKKVGRKLRDRDSDSATNIGGDVNTSRGNESRSEADSGGDERTRTTNEHERERYTTLNVSSNRTERENGSDGGSDSGGDIGGRDGGNDNGRNRSYRNDERGDEHTQTIITNAPRVSRDAKTINFETLFNDSEIPPTGKRRGRKKGSKNRKTDYDIPGLEDLFKIIFSIPVMIGLGEHWELDELEATELKTAFLKVAGNIDNRSFQKVLELINKLSPWAGLVICVYIITMPRIQQTSELLNEQSRTEKTIHSVDKERTNSSANAVTPEINFEPNNQQPFGFNN